MSAAHDDRLIAARARPIEAVADLLEIRDLKRAGRELIGPCPSCGGDDRFSINTQKGVFQCRRCEGKGDAIEMVRWLRGMTLPQALEWMVGPAVEISAEERAARAKTDAENRARKEAVAERERKKAVQLALALWREGQPPEGTAVRDYLARRGFGPDVLPQIPQSIRFHPDLPFMVKVDREWVEVMRGPAMLTVVQRPSGGGSAVHRTWIDLSHPKGKAILCHPTDGRSLPSKKVIGSKKGGAIRLCTPKVFDTLVMAEGIETTLTAMVSGEFAGAAFWAGVDLGNLAGSRQLGPGLKYAGLPDMADEDAFVPPPWVKHLVLIEDGDSDPRDTRAKLLAGARRAMLHVPGLAAQIVPCPAGMDLNDLLMMPAPVAVDQADQTGDDLGDAA